MTLQLPVELKEKVIEEAHVAGDLSRIALFAMAHTDPKEVTIIQTRKTGLGLRLDDVARKQRISRNRWWSFKSS